MPKTWSRTVEAHGIQVRLFRRRPGGPIYRDVAMGRVISESGKVRTEHDVRSLRTTNKDRAEELARVLAKRIAEAQLTGRADHRLTLAQLFVVYRRYHLPTLTSARRKEAEARIAMFTEAWGGGLQVADVDASRIKAYARKRRSLEVIAPGRRPDEEGRKGRGYRKPEPPRDGALDAEFRWLNSVFNFGVDHKVEGRPLLSRNPLPKGGKKRRRAGWPKERNPRRPVASQARYEATMRHVDEVDPAGRLACILSLARLTGRRESAIVSLRASDLLLSKDRVRSALAEAGMNEDLVHSMPFGAIRWAAESDKQGLLSVSPISQETRAAVDRYLRRTPRVGDIPLFAAPKDPSRPISRHTAAKWLIRAEAAAGQVKLKGGVFHPYRRAWAIERKHLPAHDVAAAGGWTDTQALTLIYQKATPAGVLEAVNAGPDGAQTAHTP